MHKSEWICYLIGAIVTLAWKLSRYVYFEKKSGKPAGQSVIEWFFEKSGDNLVSWGTTIGAVWVIGSVYINQIGLFDWKIPLPLDNGIAFFLGALMEMIAPSLAKWLTQKITEKLKAVQS
jgi:hypothetical protein